MHANAEFQERMLRSRELFVQGDTTHFISFFEDFLRDQSVRSIRGFSEQTLQKTIQSFWAAGSVCLSEVWLLADPTAKYGEGRNAYLDLLITSAHPVPSFVPVIELKNVSLVSLWMASRGDMSAIPYNADLEKFRAELRDESEEQLLQRQFCYHDQKGRLCMESVQGVKENAFAQAAKYLRILKAGRVSDRGTKAGLLDPRVLSDEGTDRLDGYVVICIGATKVLAWKTGAEPTQYTFRSKVVTS